MSASVDDLSADLDRTIGGYLGRLSQEVARGECGQVTVTVQLDGEITDIDIPDRALRNASGYDIGETVLAAVRDAHAKAALRRQEIADATRIMGEPVAELAQQLIDDPVGTACRLSAPRW